MKLDREASFYVAGHRGMVGSAILRRLKAAGFENLVTRTSGELDLTDRQKVGGFFQEVRPRYVVLAAARVGGILANDTYSADFLSENLQIQVNVMDAALAVGVERLAFMGSSCIYPKFADQPINETALMTGHLEPTNEAYAVAKIAGLKHVQAIRKQHGLNWMSIMPSNLYGPGDNYTEGASHVLPALIRRYSEAAEANESLVVNWGTGTPLRELMYVDDLADATLFLMENYDDDSHVNVGTGQDLSIRQIAELVAKAVGYEGETQWDQTKPDGTPRKVLDISRIESMGWAPKVALEDGIRLAVADFKKRFGV
ncbi:MAG: GDP-L-fucose synthase [Rhodoluna sp.]